MFGLRHMLCHPSISPPQVGKKKKDGEAPEPPPDFAKMLAEANEQVEKLGEKAEEADAAVADAGGEPANALQSAAATQRLGWTRRRAAWRFSPARWPR